MRIFYTREFEYQFHKINLKLQNRVLEKIDIFQNNPHHPILKNHPLHGELKGKRSINITGDWRAIYYLVDSDVYFCQLGRHIDLYG